MHQSASPQAAASDRSSVAPQRRRTTRPTIRDVARRAGVAVSTVSHALSGRRRVSADTAARIEAAIAELGYRPNALAQAMITGRSQTLGLILPDIVNPFFAHVARGAEDFARDQGYSLILCNTDLRPESELGYVETLLARQVDGVLFMPGSTSAERAYQRLVESGVAFVLMDEALPGPDSAGVFSDNEDGGRQAGSHLAATGVRRCVFIGGPRELPTVQEKEAGFRRGLAEHGLTPSATAYGTYRTDSGYAMMQRLLDQGVHPDGVFAADDLLALGAMQAIQQQGLRVPEDVAVCGFDGMPGSELWNPPLTTIAQRIPDLGATAVRLLVSLLTGSLERIPRVVLPVDLVVRGSSRGMRVVAA